MSLIQSNYYLKNYNEQKYNLYTKVTYSSPSVSEIALSIPSNTHAVLIKLWGAGGAGNAANGSSVGGAGGFSSVRFVPNSSCSYVISLGFAGFTAVNTPTGGSFMVGGIGTGGSGNFGSGGGDASLAAELISGTYTLLAVAGGGGGAGINPAVGSGGGGNSAGGNSTGATGGSGGAGGSLDGSAAVASAASLAGLGGAGGFFSGLTATGRGGGGGGYGGGGRPSSNFGGAGGGGYVSTGTSNTLIIQSGGVGPTSDRFAANSSDSDYTGTYGNGGLSGANGSSGYIVVYYFTGFPVSMGPLLFNDNTTPATLTNPSLALTYIPKAKISASNTSTTTIAASLMIEGAPYAGTNETITNPFSLYISSGSTFIGSTTQSTSSSTGSLIVSGGIGIGNGSSTAPTLNWGTFSSFPSKNISLFNSNNNNYQFYGFGISSAQLNYNVDSTSSDHVFYAGTSSTTNSELFRIKGNNTIAMPSSGVLTLANTSASSSSITGAIQCLGGAYFGAASIFNQSISITDGTVSTPAIVFSSEQNTGIYRSGASVLDISITGSRRLAIGTNTFTHLSTGLYSIGNITYTPAATTGAVYSSGSFQSCNDATSSGTVAQYNCHFFGRKTLTASSATTYTNSFNVFISGPTSASTNVTTTNRYSLGLDWGSIINLNTGSLGGQIIWPLGSVSVPSYTFLADTNTGMYSSTADNVDITCGGVNTLNLNTSFVTTNKPLRVSESGRGFFQLSAGNITDTGATVSFFPASGDVTGPGTYNVSFPLNGTGSTSILVNTTATQTLTNKTMGTLKVGTNGTSMSIMATGTIAGTLFSGIPIAPTGNATYTLSLSAYSFASTPNITGSIQRNGAGNGTNGTILNACILTFGKVQSGSVEINIYNAFGGGSMSNTDFNISWIAWT